MKAYSRGARTVGGDGPENRNLLQSLGKAETRKKRLKKRLLLSSLRDAVKNNWGKRYHKIIQAKTLQVYRQQVTASRK